MKKKLYRAALMAMACLASSAAYAYDAKVGNIYYNFHGTEAEVTYLLEEDWGNAEAYKGEVTIPTQVTHEGVTYTVTAIGYAAFFGCEELTSVKIPESVTSIAEDAFYSCTKLSGIFLPDAVTSIGNCAFEYCEAISKFSFPEHLKSIGESAFDGCTALDEFTLPEGLETIGRYAFSGCAMTSVSIPASVTSIGERAFMDCSALSTVTMAGNVAYIDDSAFEKTPWFDAYSSDPANVYEGVFYLFNTAVELKDPTLTSIKFKPGTTAIGEIVFYGLEGLTSVVIPEGVVSIGEMAFAECPNLTSISLPSSLTSIGRVAFGACPKLADITVAAGNTAYTTVDGVLFDKAMSTLVLYPAAKDAYSYTVPEGVETIGYGAVAFVTNLGEVNLPHSLVTIAPSAFGFCTGLTSISLPENVETIGENAFTDCPINDVICWAAVPPSLHAYAFDDPTVITLHVNDRDAYTAAPVWNTFLLGYMKCATPTITIEGDEIVFSCDTPGAEFSPFFYAWGDYISPDRVGMPTTLTISVSAYADGYDTSDSATYTINIAAGDTDRDGTLSISDVSKLVNKLLGK